MANHKEKNTVDYFPFLCKEGKAMFYMENTYGNDGFATWFKILRQLAVTNYHYLDLGDKMEVMFLSAKCKVSEEKLLKIIQDLVNLGEFDRKLWDNYQLIWCHKFIENIQDAYRKRSNPCVNYDDILRSIDAKRRSIDPIRRSEGGTFRSEGGEKEHTILDYTILDNTILKKDENPSEFSCASNQIKIPELVDQPNLIKEKILPKRETETTQIVDENQILMTWPTFEDFWETYDKKRGDQAKIKKKWEALKQAEKEAAIEFIPYYIQSQPEKQFRKDPATFLNNKSWNDELITSNQPKQIKPSSAAGSISKLYQRISASS
jgi:hypothetical protein